MNNSELKLIWIGPLVPSKYLKNWRAVSPAAVKWQKNLLKGLIKNNVDLEWIYYRPDAYWPKGRLFPWTVSLKNDLNYAVNQIKYVNLPGYRNLSIKKNLSKILKKINIKKNQSPAIISYNAPIWMKHIFSDCKVRSKFNCIYLVADEKAPKGADGYIFLSYDFYQRYNCNNLKLHLDGAIYPKVKDSLLNKKFKSKKKTIFFYSGSLGKWGGAKILLDAMNLIKRDDFELWISGFGDENFFKKAAQKDVRIKYLGLLTDNNLQNAYKKANIFLNPRPFAIAGNENNFPSKLFDYLAWKKPIISTWTKGLSPEYRKILNVVEDSPIAFARAMIKYIGVKQRYINRHHNWFKKKTWDNQAIKIINFLNEI